MKTREKAINLVEMFDETLTYLESKNKAKQCALICVEEMLDFAYDVEWEKKEDALSKIKFLKEVKQEINKL